MANDYYDFNPSATSWALMLTGMVVFVVALSVLLIYFIARSEDWSTGRPREARAVPEPRAAAAEVKARPARPTPWTRATHGHV